MRAKLRSCVAALGFLVVGNSALRAETLLTVFISSLHAPDVTRRELARFEAANPGTKIRVQTAGATSDLMSQYLSTVFSANDPTIDAFMFDVIKPAQFTAAGWTTPMDPMLADGRAPLLREFLPVYGSADVINGNLVALPAFSDGLFLFYRKDLLAKYNLAPPRTWSELAHQVATIQAGEHNETLQGLNIAGKSGEAAVPWFLLPYLSQGKGLFQDGQFAFDRAATVRSFSMWTDFVRAGVIPKNTAEFTADGGRRDFQAGKVIFNPNWSFAWHLLHADDSPVRDKVGVAVLPGMDGGEPVSIVGGMQWAISAFSKHPKEAMRLVLFMTGEEASKEMTVEGGLVPARRDLYADPAVIAASPWLANALPIVEAERVRPTIPRYSEFSDAVAMTVNSVLAGTLTPEQAAETLEARLRRILR